MDYVGLRDGLRNGLSKRIENALIRVKKMVDIFTVETAITITGYSF